MIERLTDKIVNRETREVLAYRLKENIHPIKSIQKLGRYEDTEEEKRLVVLPCDTVYFICDKGKYARVRSKSIFDLFICEIDGIDKEGRYWSNKEKAEKALKEMENA